MACRSLVSWLRLCSSWIQPKPSCLCSKVSRWCKLTYGINIDSFLAFGRFESKETAADLIVPKLLFIGLHLLTILLGVYKVNAMGLLPTTTSDWLAFLPHKQASKDVYFTFAYTNILYRYSNMLNYNKSKHWIATVTPFYMHFCIIIQSPGTSRNLCIWTSMLQARNESLFSLSLLLLPWIVIINAI